MPQCKWCGRSGFLLTLTKNGLCGDCDQGITMEVQRMAQIIQQSLEIIEKSKNLSTQLSNLDVINHLAEDLKKYEARGISTIKPLPSTLLQGYQQKKNELIKRGLETEIENAWAKASVANTTTTKINHLSKSLLIIREYRPKIDDQKLLDALEKKIKDMIHNIQLNAYLETAKKAEFKGQNKKALDQYQEALYFLKTDRVDDSLQIKYISFIETKIAKLKSGS